MTISEFIDAYSEKSLSISLRTQAEKPDPISEHIVELTNANFYEVVMHSPEDVLVLFYATHSGASTKLMPEYIK